MSEKPTKPSARELRDEATMLRRMRLQLLAVPKTPNRDQILDCVEVALELVNDAEKMAVLDKWDEIQEMRQEMAADEYD